MRWRLALWVALVGWLAVACVVYSRGERYLCFAPFDVRADHCKQPPYHYPHSTYPNERPLEETGEESRPLSPPSP